MGNENQLVASLNYRVRTRVYNVLPIDAMDSHNQKLGTGACFNF